MFNKVIPFIDSGLSIELGYDDECQNPSGFALYPKEKTIIYRVSNYKNTIHGYVIKTKMDGEDFQSNIYRLNFDNATYKKPHINEKGNEVIKMDSNEGICFKRFDAIYDSNQGFWENANPKQKALRDKALKKIENIFATKVGG